MKNLQAILLTPNTTIEATLQAIDQGAVGAALIVDANKKLKGMVTDGDLRRAILHGRSITDLVCTVMNAKPCIATEDLNSRQLLALMQSKISIANSCFK